MNAMSGLTFVYLAIFAALLVAVLWRSSRGSLGMIAVAGIIGAGYAYQAHGFYAVVLPALVALVGGVQAASGLIAGRTARFERHEQPLRRGLLSGMSRANARTLIDQGLWIDASAGDILTREGEPVTHLHWIVDGAAEMIMEDAPTGSCGPRSLVGEANIFNEEPATATIKLTADSKLWSIEAETLRAYAEAHPDVRQILDHGFTRSLAEKLDAVNRAEANA
ncbi:MAG: cyclic nucleotide-binding domain-containing protein [Pseudomonadota bacterium]|nr:cyclic nucleotide-binding domain-containing protein [Pseudomonadota bacterium]